MSHMEFEYFNGMEAEQYSFYRIPKILFTEECFKQLSCEAKVLYGLLLDRMGLSDKNRWVDEQNRVYIIFTVENIVELLNCGRQKAIRCLAELDTEKEIGLIEKKRPGLGKPNVIYVKNFMQKGGRGQETDKSMEDKCGAGLESRMEEECSREPGHNMESGDGNLQMHEIQTSRSMKVAVLESAEQGQECREQNWWEMEFSCRKIPQPDSGIHENQEEKTERLSMKIPGMGRMEHGHPLGGMFSDISGSDFQKYENHTSGSPENILQENMESCPKGHENHIYRKMGMEAEDNFLQNPQKYENHTSGSSRITLLEVPKSYLRKFQNHTSVNSGITLAKVPESYLNDTEYSDTDLNHTEKNDTETGSTDLNHTNTGLCNPIQSYLSCQYSYPSGTADISAAGRGVPTDMEDKMGGYRSVIRNNIDYACFEVDRYYSLEDVDKFVELMVEVMAMPDDGSLRIAGVERPVSVVKSRFMKINKGHIEYVMGCLQNNTTKIGNIKAYLLTSLYNATLTISSYYRAEVNHDMYGGG